MKHPYIILSSTKFLRVVLCAAAMLLVPAVSSGALLDEINARTQTISVLAQQARDNAAAAAANSAMNLQGFRGELQNSPLFDLRNEFERLQTSGKFVRTTVKQSLTFANTMKTDYNKWVSPTCDGTSDCGAFRQELKQFFSQLAIQAANFSFSDSELADGSRMARIVNKAPRLLLYGLAIVWEDADGLQALPTELQTIFDNVGDPAIFQAPSGPIFTTTKAYCDEQQEAGKLSNYNPVMLVRYAHRLDSAANSIDKLTEIVPETWNVNIAGEGTDLPVPVKAPLVKLKKLLEKIKDRLELRKEYVEACEDAGYTIAYR